MTTICFCARKVAYYFFGLTFLISKGAFRAAHYTDAAGNKRADIICTPVEGFENILDGFAASVPGFTWEVQK